MGHLGEINAEPDKLYVCGGGGGRDMLGFVRNLTEDKEGWLQRQLRPKRSLKSMQGSSHDGVQLRN